MESGQSELVRKIIAQQAEFVEVVVIGEFQEAEGRCSLAANLKRVGKGVLGKPL
jgi:hypothetical protein